MMAAPTGPTPRMSVTVVLDASTASASRLCDSLSCASRRRRSSTWSSATWRRAASAGVVVGNASRNLESSRFRDQRASDGCRGNLSDTDVGREPVSPLGICSDDCERPGIVNDPGNGAAVNDTAENSAVSRRSARAAAQHLPRRREVPCLAGGIPPFAPFRPSPLVPRGPLARPARRRALSNKTEAGPGTNDGSAAPQGADNSLSGRSRPAL